MRQYRFPSLERILVAQNNGGMHLDELEREEQKSLKAAFSAGKLEGIKEGREIAAAEFNDRLTQIRQSLKEEYEQLLSTFIETGHAYRISTDLALKQSVVSTVKALANAVIRVELRNHPELVVRASEEVLAALDGVDEVLAISMSAQDLSRLKALNINQLGNLVIQQDDNLEEGVVQFSGSYQLHLLDFNQRLNTLLESVLDEGADVTK
jgi:flagellar biosynthesis/type III secretory pathway protein FliH